MPDLILEELSHAERGEYIKHNLLHCSNKLKKQVANYVKYATENEARVSNDGFPDTRFKGTFHKKDITARRYINKLRKKYEFKLKERNKQVYVVVSQQVAESYLNKIKDLFKETHL